MSQPVNGQDIVNMLRAGLQPVVMFHKTFAIDAYGEKGMRARITGFDQLDHEMVNLHFDYNEFKECNLPLEGHDYFDKNQVACLTATEAGFLKDGKETVYVMLEGELEFAPAENTALFIEYKQLGQDASYVAWLENQVRALRADQSQMFFPG